MSYDIRDTTPCAHCGEPPLVCEDDDGRKVRVDACFKGALRGSYVSACCGHGDLARVYARVEVRESDGHLRQIDLCGVLVQDYGHYRSPHKYTDVEPPRNVKGTP